MGRLSDAIKTKIAKYYYKLRSKGFGDDAILHKIYANFGTLLDVGRSGLILAGINPYPREHAVRILQPKKGQYARVNNKFGKGIHAIYLNHKLQAIRFDSSKHSVSEVKRWLKRKGIIYIKFEGATMKKRKNPQVDIDLTDLQAYLEYFINDEKKGIKAYYQFLEKIGRITQLSELQKDIGKILHDEQKHMFILRQYFRSLR